MKLIVPSISHAMLLLFLHTQFPLSHWKSSEKAIFLNPFHCTVEYFHFDGLQKEGREYFNPQIQSIP